jgi:hypothetical protein
MKDWTGNSQSAYTCNGASNHSLGERQQVDYYATDPATILPLLEREGFASQIWEPACGEGHLSKELERVGKAVRSTDLIDRGYGEGNIDFLMQFDPCDCDIITNPPYSLAQEFVEHALFLQDKSEVENLKTAMFLKLTFLEGKQRKKMFEKHPPCKVYVFSSRQQCAKNGEFNKDKNSTAIAYAWYVWHKGFSGKPEIEWI